MMRTFSVWGWGSAAKLGLTDGKVRVAEGERPIDKVVARLQRDSGLVCCAGPRDEGVNLEDDVVVSRQWVLTSGRPCRGGGFTPEGEVWVSIPPLDT